MQDIFTNIKSDMWLLLVGGGGVEYFFSDFQIRSTDFFFFFTNFTEYTTVYVLRDITLIYTSSIMWLNHM